MTYGVKQCHRCQAETLKRVPGQVVVAFNRPGTRYLKGLEVHFKADVYACEHCGLIAFFKAAGEKVGG